MTLVLPESSLFGQAVDMVAIVATANAQPLPLNGTMTFTVDGVAQPPMLGGIANFPQFLLTLNLSAGVHTISADYDGDSNVFAEGTTGTITVNRADTAATISIITSGEGAIFGGPVAFSVTINRTTLGTGTPTGLVILKEGNTTLASAPLESGQVSFTIPDFSAGTHTVIATYEGDDSFFGSTTFPRTVVVREAATATSVSSSPGVTTFGRDVTFTATFRRCRASRCRPPVRCISSTGAMNSAAARSMPREM